jgi:hypothetical protein
MNIQHRNNVDLVIDKFADYIVAKELAWLIFSLSTYFLAR